MTDGQEIDATAHFETLDQQGTTWAGTLVFDDGPLEGQTVTGGGYADVSFNLGAPVRVSGTVHLTGGQVAINPMVVTPALSP